MALTTNQLIVGMFNAAAGGYKANISTYISNMGANGVESAAEALLSQSPLGAQFLGQPLYKTDAAFSSAVVSSLLPGLSASTSAAVNEAVTGFWALNPSLTRSELVVKLIEAVVAIPATDPLLGSAASSFNAKVALADAYAGTSTDMAVLMSVVGSTPTSNNSFSLTLGQDNLVGTAGDDTFTARIFDNGNSAQSGDKIDGGAGNDYLVADIGNSQKFAITLETTGVESVAIRAQAVAVDTNNNNMQDPTLNPGDPITYGNQVQIDAQRMVGVTTWESNNSRADLVIEDVRILNSQITKDITIAMVETDPGHVDMGVYFDQLSLRNFSSTTSQLNLRVIDTYAVALGKAPLLDSPYGSFKFTATQNGVDTVVTLASQAMQDAQTYVELAAAIQAQLDLQFGAGNATATVGANFTVPDSVTSQLVTGQAIVITANADITFTTPAGSGWLANDVVPAISGLHTSYDSAQTASTDLVTSKIILDDVGRGSTGGDLVVGGLSVGDTSSSLGVQRFEIEVRDNSKLQTINSTNNTLREVVIVNGLTTSSSNAYVPTIKDAGILHVNGIVGGATGQNAPLPGSAAQHNASGFSDVRLIDASAMRGNVQFTAEVTTESVAKYLNAKDVAALPAGDNVAFVYSTGAGNDVMNITVDSAVAASNTLTGREDFSFTANGGAGNDSITLQIGGNKTGPWLLDQRLNKNVFINGGDGNDTIKTPGAGDVRIDAGNGNDTVYADNSGTLQTNAWIIAASNTLLADLSTLDTAGTQSSFLYKGKLTVAFSAAALSNSVTMGVADSVAAPFTNGWEVVVDVPTGANYSVTQLHVNQAIKAAINSDPVLSKLLVAADGPGNTLTVKSLIDGKFIADDFQATITAPDVSALAVGEQGTVLSAYKAFSNISTSVIGDAQAAQAASVVAKNLVTGMDAAQVLGTDGVDGTISGAESDNTINMGAGDDVLVLGTGADSNDTVVFTGYNLGKDTIVNYSDVGANIDKLDFTSYLNNKTSLSGSVDSQKRIATAFDANTTAEANSVTVLNGTFNTTTDTFAGLTTAKLLTALNTTGTVAYAGLNDGSLDALTTYITTAGANNLVGGIGKAVVMVHNNLNEGEYAVFELTFNGLASNLLAEFSAAQVIGVVDFGNTVTFTAPQFA